jgi:hypothetical protein
MRFALALWLIAASLAGAADGVPQARPSLQPLQPVGVFANIRATQDHTYGQQARLWFRGTQLVGDILYWDGNIEGQRGRFTDGFINRRTGDVRFKVVIVRRDVQPHVRTEGAFEGLLVKGVLAGTLTWLGESAKQRAAPPVEQWKLALRKEESQETFAGIEAWQRGMGE